MSTSLQFRWVPWRSLSNAFNHLAGFCHGSYIWLPFAYLQTIEIDATDSILMYRYQEAFNVILNLGDIPTLVWLCSILGPSTVLSSNLLAQTTLLILLNQLAFELSQVRYFHMTLISAVHSLKPVHAISKDLSLRNCPPKK